MTVFDAFLKIFFVNKPARALPLLKRLRNLQQIAKRKISGHQKGVFRIVPHEKISEISLNKKPALAVDQHLLRNGAFGINLMDRIFEQNLLN